MTTNQSMQEGREHYKGECVQGLCANKKQCKDDELVIKDYSKIYS